MNTDGLTVSNRLGRIRALLSGLTGPLSNGELHAWANLGNAEGMPREVFQLIDGLDSSQPRRPDAPGDILESPVDLAARLAETDEDGALHRLISIVSTTLAYRTPGRYDEVKAKDVFGSLLYLLGHDTRWWTTTDAPAWNPVTRHVFDAVVVGVGNGIIVTVLAFDED
ncbi:hypothetical protein [Actinomadura litoris]|uniref:Uncharacterized protein n=1 Tax=Actinomadura litoris TaxID=2678616 RepID=A0A7K1LB90_9ACTN|nr:hypothetical protein [Actinomadura litoris]MUN41688.1 hypothetical protein [Actinomadura litoris]